MANSHAQDGLSVREFAPSQRLKTIAFVMMSVGVLGFIVGMIRNQEALWPAYLTAFFFVSSLGLAGMFWAAINHMAKAGWSVSIRRVAEGFTAFIPWMVAGSLVLLLGIKHLYPWADPEILAQSYLIAGKSAYLNVPFLIVRLLVFGLGAWYFAHKIVGNSLAQDKSGDVKHTHQNVALSVAYILFFAIFFSLFSVDLLMSLHPTWYSTIYGIYMFAGMAQSGMALLILAMIYLKRQGFVKGYFGIEHIHDVAKYLKGFTVFWAYISFSQFMLIWYANIPEETEFYLLRTSHGWMYVTMGLLVFKFIIPFLALLPRAAKRTESHLILVACLVLVTQYADVYWQVYPNFNENHLVFDFYSVSQLVGFLGLFLFAVMRFYQKHSLVAVKDPRISEALSHHVTY